LSLKWITTGLLAMSILGVEAGFTSTKSNPAHRSENITNDALQSPQAINQALDHYFARHHIWHGPLPLLPETLGISTVINPKYPHAFIVNLIYSAKPTALNSPNTNPYIHPDNVWGTYARTPISLANSVVRWHTNTYKDAFAFAGAGMMRLPQNLLTPAPSWHLLIPGWRKSRWIRLSISSTITAMFTSRSPLGFPTVVWQQNQWWCILQGALGNTRKEIQAGVRGVATQAAVDGGLPGRGTLYVSEAGDGQHTGAAWELDRWDYIVGNYRATALALTVVHRWARIIRSAAK
jgi:hypothetical protein